MRCAIAGYMGSGKSSCAESLPKENTSVINADIVAKRMMNRNDHIRQSISDTFGTSCILSDSINFPVLASIVFQSVERMKQLNSIVHPLLRQEIIQLFNKTPDSALCVLDAALVPLLHIDSYLDCTIWVECSREIRIQRMLIRTGLDYETIKTRMEIQEQLFAPPKGPKCCRVRNETTIQYLVDTANTIISSCSKKSGVAT